MGLQQAAGAGNFLLAQKRGAANDEVTPLARGAGVVDRRSGSARAQITPVVRARRRVKIISRDFE